MLTLSLLSASFLSKKNPFLLENASNLAHEFVYDNLNKKIFVNFPVKLSYKNSCIKFDVFSKRNISFFLLKNEALRSESVKITINQEIILQSNC